VAGECMIRPQAGLVMYLNEAVSCGIVRYLRLHTAQLQPRSEPFNAGPAADVAGSMAGK
jgi:hypothetical protein